MEEKITRRNVIELWASKYSEVTRWLTKLQKKPDSALWFYRFCRWAHKTPPELLALKEKDPSANMMEKLLDDFCGVDLADFTNSEKYNTAIAVKSFFKHNYRDLAKASGVVTFQKVKPYNALNKEGLRKLWNLALNPRDRALITFVTSTGIAKETLANLLWGHLEPDWETKDFPCINIGSELLKGHGRGKYQNVRQITFLTPEAKRNLMVYRDWIQEKIGRNLGSQDHIWLSTYKPYEPLSYQMLGNQINILSHNAKVPFSLHDGRRWVNTALEQIGISTNWAKKIRGRKVRGEDAPYSQPAIEQLRAKFKEAVPLLEFTSEAQAIPKDVQEQLLALEEEQKKIKLQWGIVRASSKRRKPRSTDCPDGEHCQQIVTEEDLAGFLADGWKVVATLPSGKIIIDSE
jgi:integrase